MRKSILNLDDRLDSTCRKYSLEIVAKRVLSHNAVEGTEVVKSPKITTMRSRSIDWVLQVKGTGHDFRLGEALFCG